MLKSIESDRDIINNKVKEMLNAIKLNDKEKLIVLFSKSSISDSRNINTSINELFDYYGGDILSFDDGGGPYVSTDNNYGNVIKEIESSYDIKTTEDKYRIAIKYVYKDDYNEDNVGITSLYVIKYNDDSNTEYAYWGDGKNTPGINIGIPNLE